MKKFNKASAAVAIAITGLLLAGCSSSGNDGSGALKIGSLLPETGSLAFLGPPEFAGVDLAIQDINAAGGVLGKDAEHLRGDSGDTSSEIAQQTVDAHIAAGVGAIIGAASSGVSLTVIDKIASAGIVQISPANTSPELSTYAEDGYYFRTAPSDTFQGAILGQLMAKNGAKNAVFILIDDSYGNGLTKYARSAFTGQATEVIYDPQATEFAADVAKAKAAKPDAIAIIGFVETTKIIAELAKQGIGPKNVKTYLVDGNLSGSAYKDLPAGVMNGVKATTPGVYVEGDFKNRLLAVDPSLTDFTYAAESYDAVILAALAAEQAGKTDGTSIRDNMISVSSGGTKCTTFADCKALIASGTDIDYDGVSGPVEFDANGDPSKATMGVYEYTSNDKYVPRPEQFISGDVPAGE
jgi:ABC-type branched-subunit amino acid transport system substrate-binding protein